MKFEISFTDKLQGKDESLEDENWEELLEFDEQMDVDDWADDMDDDDGNVNDVQDVINKQEDNICQSILK